MELQITLIHEMKELVEAFEVVKSALLGKPIRKERYVVVWNDEVKERFVEFMRARGRDEWYTEKCIYYLNRFVREIRGPEDIIAIFAECQRGKHHLDRAVRNLLKLYQQVLGYPKEFIDRLREAIPATKTGVDLYVPEEDEVIETLRKLESLLPKYKMLWHFILDSGIRKSHAVKLLNAWDESKLQKVNGFYRYTIGIEHTTKLTFYAYITPYTLKLIREFKASGEKLNTLSIESYTRKKKLTPCKLIRKFAYNMMIKCGIPPEVADFINGRKPRSVGATHYMLLRMHADENYQKYVKYLEELRQKTIKINQ